MKLFEQIDLMSRINQLIKLKATGSPEALAERLGVSKRQIHRYIEDLKDMGLKIGYCKRRKTYYTEDDAFLKFKASIVEDGQERKIMGGENISTIFEDIFQSDKKWHSPFSSL